MADDSLADLASLGSEHADAPAGDEDAVSERREKAGRFHQNYRPPRSQEGTETDGLVKNPRLTVL
jgi:hypothetical protein